MQIGPPEIFDDTSVIAVIKSLKETFIDILSMCSQEYQQLKILLYIVVSAL